MILFGLYTGARLSDVASLTWENVDLPARELRFIAKKTGKTIILPLDGPLAAHVEALAAADSPRTPLHSRAFSIVEKQGKTGHLSNTKNSLAICLRRRACEKSNRTAKPMTRNRGDVAGMSAFHSTP